jgi:hypothetical protein
LEKEKSRTEYEEETMSRLPLTKAQKKGNIIHSHLTFQNENSLERKLMREKRMNLLAGGTILNDLSSFVDQAIDVNFEDPTLPTPSQIHSKNLVQGLNAVTKESLRKDLSRSKKEDFMNADAHVEMKNITRKKSLNTTDEYVYFYNEGFFKSFFLWQFSCFSDYFGGGDMNDILEEQPDSYVPPIVQDAIDKKVQKKESRSKQLREKALSALPSLDETLEGKRGKNKCLER